MKRLTTVATVIALAALMAGPTACRRDHGDDGDSVVVFTPDTLDYGVWQSDTATTSLDWLDRHQASLRDVFFGYDSSDLDAAASEALMQDAAYMMANSGFKVLIEGHCDERGTIDYNLALGERRALAGRDFLVNYGVPSSRLQYVSYGKERPFVTGTGVSVWAQNRRAHFRVLPE